LPNSRDSAKRHRQNQRRRAHNRSIRSRVRTITKVFEVSVDKQDKAEAESHYAEFAKLIDKAAGKGLYHRNTAARKKSRMHKKLAALI